MANFKYTTTPNNNPRPILKVEFSSLDEKNVLQPYMLVDSGSDVTVIDIQLAPLLGVTISKCTKGTITGVGGTKLVAYQSKLLIKMLDRKTLIDVVFCDLIEKGYGMLGQRGFFEHFIVSFNGNKKLFSVESPYSV